MSERNPSTACSYRYAARRRYAGRYVSGAGNDGSVLICFEWISVVRNSNFARFRSDAPRRNGAALDGEMARSG